MSRKSAAVVGLVGLVHVHEMIGRAGLKPNEAALIEGYLKTFASDQVASRVVPAAETKQP